MATATTNQPKSPTEANPLLKAINSRPVFEDTSKHNHADHPLRHFPSHDLPNVIGQVCLTCMPPYHLLLNDLDEHEHDCRVGESVLVDVGGYGCPLCLELFPTVIGAIVHIHLCSHQTMRMNLIGKEPQPVVRPILIPLGFIKESVEAFQQQQQWQAQCLSCRRNFGWYASETEALNEEALEHLDNGHSILLTRRHVSDVLSGLLQINYICASCRCLTESCPLNKLHQCSDTEWGTLVTTKGMDVEDLLLSSAVSSDRLIPKENFKTQIKLANHAEMQHFVLEVKFVNKPGAISALPASSNMHAVRMLFKHDYAFRENIEAVLVAKSFQTVWSTVQSENVVDLSLDPDEKYDLEKMQAAATSSSQSASGVSRKRTASGEVPVATQSKKTNVDVDYECVDEANSVGPIACSSTATYDDDDEGEGNSRDVDVMLPVAVEDDLIISTQGNEVDDKSTVQVASEDPGERSKTKYHWTVQVKHRNSSSGFSVNPLKDMFSGASAKAKCTKNVNKVRPKPQNLKAKKGIIFMDFDNWQKRFPEILDDIPEDCLLWLFWGGKTVFQEPLSDPMYADAKKRGNVFINPKCGTCKNAADMAICFEVGRTHKAVSSSIPFTILSGDFGFRELENQFRDRARRLVVITPHQKEAEMLQTELKSVIDT